MTLHSDISHLQERIRQTELALAKAQQQPSLAELQQMLADAYKEQQDLENDIRALNQERESLKNSIPGKQIMTPEHTKTSQNIPEKQNINRVIKPRGPSGQVISRRKSRTQVFQFKNKRVHDQPIKERASVESVMFTVVRNRRLASSS